MQKLKYEPIFGFSGQNRNTSPFLIKPGELADTENLVSEKVGVLKKTGDYTIKNSQITSGRSILGGIDFLRADGTHVHIIAIDGDPYAQIYMDVNGTWVKQVDSLAPGKRVRFTYSPSLDTLFAVNESNDTLSFNGTSWSKVTNVQGAPRGKAVLNFGNKVYILNANIVTQNSSLSPSVSPSISPSLSPSISPSRSPSSSISPSISTSPSVSPSASVSPSSSISPSISVSPSKSPSVSPSVSISPSSSISPSVSPSVSTSPSSSISPSSSPSVSPSASTSPSASRSPSASTSPSVSISPSSSISPSISPSVAPSYVSYPTRAYRSSLVDSGSITWDTVNDWIVFDDVIVGGGYNGDNMMVMCENSVHVFTISDDKYQASDRGCVSHESICSYKSLTFWASTDGMYLWNGSRDQKFSLPIQDVWDSISLADLQNIQAAVIGDNLYVYLGTATIDGKTVANTMYCYDISQDDWNRIKLGATSNHLHTFTTSSGKRLFMGDTDGKVYQMFTGQSQNGSPFRGMVETDWMFGSGEREIDSYMELWGFGEKLASMKVFAKVDDGEYQPLGELNGSTDYVSFNMTGYRIRFMLQETSKGYLYELSRLEVGFVPKYSKKTDDQT